MKKMKQKNVRKNDGSLIALTKFTRRQLLSILQFARLLYRERYYSWHAKNANFLKSSSLDFIFALLQAQIILCFFKDRPTRAWWADTAQCESGLK